MKTQFTEDELNIKAYEVKQYDDIIISITIDEKPTIYIPKKLLEKGIKKAIKNIETIKI